MVLGLLCQAEGGLYIMDPSAMDSSSIHPSTVALGNRVGVTRSLGAAGLCALVASHYLEQDR
jgi:hypothetical protein